MPQRTPRFLLGLLVGMMFVTLAVGVSQATTLQATVSSDNRASQMLSLATSAMAKANQTLQFAYQLDIAPSVLELAETLYSTGETHVALAIATFRRESPAPPISWGNVSLVNALALDALHAFHSMIEIIAEQWDDVSILSDWRSLQATITRYEQYLEHVTVTLQITQAVYPNADLMRVMNSISNADQHLTWAAGNLTRLAVNQTTLHLNTARALLVEIQQELPQLTSSATIKGPQILRYITESRATLATYQATATSLGLDIEQSAANIIANLDTAQQFTEADAVEDAMPMLREAHQLLLDLADAIAREKGING